MYRFYKASIIAVIAAACSVMVSSAVTAEPRTTPHQGEFSSMVVPADANGILSQCGDYYTFHPDKQHYGAVPDSYNKDYIPVPQMIVPVYGYMVNRPVDVDKALALKKDENPYAVGEINRMLWEGHSFIWVAPDVPTNTFNYVKSFAADWNKTHEKKLVVLTWRGEKDLPQGREFAFSSWNISQSCMSFSAETFKSFMKQSADVNSGRDTTKIPIAPLTNGELEKF